ncbi:Crp/Fnr family transcriptional regulator [Methylobacterium sp. ID0610]|uniref:Crp/Fnr family transcriptional regulator n=1 Tax=Methylobacterium carpenticola TaxID=3344827 RepID=UPI0036B372E0
MHHFVRKLEHFVRLSGEDKVALSRFGSDIRQFRVREDVIREGDAPKVLRLMMSGWCCRYKTLEDGRRQIVGFFLPGDLCDLNTFILREMDHSIAAITPVTLAQIPPDLFNEVTLAHPRLLQALWWEALVREAIQREWTVNLGQRDALERVAHLLCEVFIRLRCVGLTEGNSCEFPITQADLGDTTGMTTVHVNRTLQEMRARGLIVLKGKTLVIPDLDALQQVGLFNPNYLHLEREGAHLDTNEA